MSAVGVGRAGEEGGEFLVDDVGQAVALKRLHEPHAEDALVLAGYDPQRIGIGAGTDPHGLHLPGDGVAALMVREVEMACVGYAVGAEGRVFLPAALDDHGRHLCHGHRRGEYMVEVCPLLGHRGVEVLRTGLHHHLLAQPPGPLACRQAVGLCRIGEREGNGAIAAGLEVEHRAQVLGRVAYYLLLSHVVALADGPPYDGIQGRHHRTAALAGEGQQRCQRHVDVDDVLPRGPRAEQPFGQMEDVVLLGDELALRLSRCASPEDVLVAGEGVDAVGSGQAVIIHVAIEPQHGVEEGAHGPHVAKAVEHMEREATLAVADIEHQAPGLLGANVPR